jgi:hypothetical protein
MRAAGLPITLRLLWFNSQVRPGDFNRGADTIETRRFAKNWDWLLAEQIVTGTAKPEPVSTPVHTTLTVMGAHNLDSSLPA